ncbi:hypothetical protein PM082_024612 [Marasmius tenuissimus]|nr:hypothetical protein PM082_024612 [Marasmius tenuissimus]
MLTFTPPNHGEYYFRPNQSSKAAPPSTFNIDDGEYQFQDFTPMDSGRIRQLGHHPPFRSDLYIAIYREYTENVYCISYGQP